MKVYSDACENAIRAVVYLAQSPGQRHTVRDIADATHVSAGYLAKTLQKLAKARILAAHRGAQGGYALRRDPESLTLLDIVHAVEPPHQRNSCGMETQANRPCTCAAHRYIDETLAMLERRFAEVTIAQLTNDVIYKPGDAE